MRIPCKVQTTFFQKAHGLMFAKRVDVPLLFDFGFSAKHAIHSLFCPPFDAVFLDAEGRVVDLSEVRSVKFWITPKKDARYLIEAKIGFAKRLKEGQAIKVNVDEAWLDLDP